jgi:predicted patatin/cPLA2 family phospholipase
MKQALHKISDFMHSEGSAKVLERLFEKKRLMEEGKPHQHIRPLLMILGGSLRGVYGGGCLIALEKHGLTKVFDNVIGISTGAPSGAYFLTSQTELGSTIYLEECVKHPFFSLKRLAPGGSPAADVDFLLNVYRGKVGNKKLNQLELKKSPSKLYFGVSNYDTGKFELLLASDCLPDVVEGIRMSMTLPFIYQEYVEHKGRRYLDGGLTNQFPIQTTINEFKPTDILIFPNCSEAALEHESTIGDYLYDEMALISLPRQLSRNIFNRHNKFVESLNWLRARKSTRPHWLIVWPDNKVGLFTQNTALLRSATNRSKKFFDKSLELIRQAL